MHRITRDVPLRRALRPTGPVRFECSERRRRGATVVHVDGEVDILTAPKLAAQLNRIVRKSSGGVVVDLRDAVFMDSAGLHVLLSAHRRVTHVSRRFAVICDDGPVRRVIELARLVETLGVVSSLRELELERPHRTTTVKRPDRTAPAA
jgi:anti-anti-sigma factor